LEPPPNHHPAIHHEPPEDDKIDVALVEHISPIEWDNVILYGQYVLDRAQVR